MTGQKTQTSKKAFKDISLTVKTGIYSHLKTEKIKFFIESKKKSSRLYPICVLTKKLENDKKQN